jgi:hypothetical protein
VEAAVTATQLEAAVKALQSHDGRTTRLCKGSKGGKGGKGGKGDTTESPTNHTHFAPLYAPSDKMGTAANADAWKDTWESPQCKGERHSLSQCPNYTGCNNCGEKSHLEWTCTKHPKN